MAPVEPDSESEYYFRQVMATNSEKLIGPAPQRPSAPRSVDPTQCSWWVTFVRCNGLAPMCRLWNQHAIGYEFRNSTGGWRVNVA